MELENYEKLMFLLIIMYIFYRVYICICVQVTEEQKIKSKRKCAEFTFTFIHKLQQAKNKRGQLMASSFHPSTHVSFAFVLSVVSTKRKEKTIVNANSYNSQKAKSNFTFHYHSISNDF